MSRDEFITLSEEMRQMNRADADEQHQRNMIALDDLLNKEMERAFAALEALGITDEDQTMMVIFGPSRDETMPQDMLVMRLRMIQALGCLTYIEDHPDYDAPDCPCAKCQEKRNANG